MPINVAELRLQCAPGGGAYGRALLGSFAWRIDLPSNQLVLAFLTQTIDWYRHGAIERQVSRDLLMSAT